ncbi:branched-subunit amino acid transport protein [Saccharopolyspora lacisalsi]|uniref:Branched-subunit amino acid transport protein n=1 Tax=Halosaccharopolyspora lacisalsi TaxID=1000566 RepID=A0A839DWB6_9PSEU|nr:AzlD domain-containing protein [Halosaccharopolyspora lacisalsi]MBA8823481.1 branched-subunit amino acid transport protein [Halosaccharopolyspora lacisalsi]
MSIGVVVLLAAGTYALRLAGVLLRGRVRLSERGRRLMSIAAMTLLGAFVATSTLVESGDFAGGARVAGVAVGGVFAWCRAPFVLAVVGAAVTTAGLRLLGVG